MSEDVRSASPTPSITSSSSSSTSSSRVSSSHSSSSPTSISSASITVYGRIRPSKNLSNAHLSYDAYANTVTLNTPSASSLNPHADQFTRDYINNQTGARSFNFDQVFPPTCSQEELFNTIGPPVIKQLIEGYNSTIFAYGQTGSGKTFTITGGADSYESRGIIPRTLTHLFDTLSSLTNKTDNAHLTYTVCISYLEIYNDNGYDLLDRSDDLAELSHLPKVTLMQDDKQCIHLTNLGEYPVNTVEDALELLFRGDTNRMICETPSNDVSTRSHCMFTITLEARNSVTNTLRRSKLHLVDLAGSERIKKTQVSGKLAQEASYINLSLHHLEQVIVALQMKRSHIPYRNSMLTSVLRDSLGGNCRTIMIATLSGEANHIDESVSTARFANRVGMIENTVWIEESADVETQVKSLKAQVKELKEEVRRLRGEQRIGEGEELTKEEEVACRESVRKYIARVNANNGEEDFSLPIANTQKAKLCFQLMREMILSGGGPQNNNSGNKNSNTASRANVEHGSSHLSNDTVQLQSEVNRLMSTVQARDEQINSLMNTIQTLKGQTQPNNHPKAVTSTLPPSSSIASQSSSSSFSSSPPLSVSPVSASDAVDPIFEAFRRSYAAYEQIEEKKDELKALIDKAKELGPEINQVRNEINQLKSLLEAKRIHEQMQKMDHGAHTQNADEDESEDAAGIRVVKQQLEGCKRSYRERFESLKETKAQIEHLKAIIERSRRKMKQDFEHWKEQQEPVSSSASSTAATSSVSLSTSGASRAIYGDDRREEQLRPSSARWKREETKESVSSPFLASAVIPSATKLSLSTKPVTVGTASASASMQPRLSSTGNAQADADIQQFYAYRSQLQRAMVQQAP